MTNIIVSGGALNSTHSLRNDLNCFRWGIVKLHLFVLVAAGTRRL